MIFYGAGGHAKVVIEAWIAAGGEVTTVLDDNESISKILHYPVQGKLNANQWLNEVFIVSIGFNDLRKKIVQRINVNYGKVIHPKSCISTSANIEHGVVVMARAVINAEVSIGKHAIINTSAIVEHDCVIEDYVHIAPGAILCGSVSVGEGTLVGAGSVIIPGVKIGKWATIGAGSVIVKDVPDGVTIMGDPARIAVKI